MSGYQNLSVNGYFDIIEGLAQADFYGCVHTYSLSNLMNRLKNESDGRRFLVCNLVRHPITRIESFWRRNTAVAAHVPKHKEFFRRIFRHSATHQALARLIEDRYEVNWEQSDNWYFVIATVNLIVDRMEIDLDAPHFRMEDLTSGKGEALRDLICFLTGNELQPTQSYLDQVSKSAPMNVQGANHIEPLDQFRKWDEWKRHLVQHVAQEHNFISGYRRFGYDLDMLRQ